MFEARYSEPVMLQVPSGCITDGKPVWTEYPGKAIITDYVERDSAGTGRIKSGNVFLLKCDFEPTADSRIVHNGRTYELKSVRICRDLDSRIECYRCACI
ncbi:MAG: hypothetical protein WCI51_03675 [Lentisphaerota bacterium]